MIPYTQFHFLLLYLKRTHFPTGLSLMDNQCLLRGILQGEHKELWGWEEAEWVNEEQNEVYMRCGYLDSFTELLNTQKQGPGRLPR